MYNQPKSPVQTSIKTIIQDSTYTYAEDAEASDAYAIALDPAITAYAAGQAFTFKANTANTGASSLNVNGLGAKTLKKRHDQDTETGDIESGSIVTAVYDGTVFQITSITASGAVGDMLIATYDPTAVGGDAFDMDNMAEGATNKILSGAERSAIVANTAKRTYPSADETKVAGIETGADVTDGVNVGSANAGATGKTTPVNADSVPIVDSEAANVIKRVTWTNIKAFLKTYFDTLYQAAGSYLSNLSEDATPQLGGTLDANSKAINEAKAGDVASATTTDLGAILGNFAFITGTTTITGLGTVAAGARRIVKFAGILTLTHNATSLILPTGANITTAADDRAEFISLGSGNWICTSYLRADGSALASSSGATVDVQTFTSNDTWTKPAGALSVEVLVLGGGGGGGAGVNAGGGNAGGGSGGGGGALNREIFKADDLGATETIVVGAASTAGNAGNPSSFGTSGSSYFVKAFGGGAGVTGSASARCGGGGGGVGGVGANGSTSDVSGGFPSETAGATGIGGGGGGGDTSGAGKGGEYGGGAGGKGDGGGAGGLGGSSVHAAGGGGGGGGTSTTTGVAGGSTGTFTAGGGGAANGGAGGYREGGGGGNGFDGGGTATAGGAGGVGGGGGGGGACKSGGTVGAGGAGGRGEVVVITYT